MTINKYISGILLVFCIGGFLSCEYINNLTQNSEITSTQQEVGEVRFIVANSPCRIILHNNESSYIDISGYNNLIEDLDIIYHNDSLIINHRNKNYIQKSKLIEITLSSKYLKKVTANMAIEMKGTEPIILDNLSMVINGGAKFSEIDLDVNAKSIALHVYGNNIGNFNLSGNSLSSFFTLEGSVNINALDLTCMQSKVIHKSIGYCKVTTNTKLNVKSYSSGNTYYIGNAQVEHERLEVPYMQSTGKVIQLN